MKLTKVEKRAETMCKWINHYGSQTINIEWKRSHTWGSNPVIESNDGKCTNISGCGYDKLSACLASCLCFLFPAGSDQYNDIAAKSGCGWNAVKECLAKYGWNLDRVASGKQFDAFKLERVSQEKGV